jgi:hypothetical protein
MKTFRVYIVISNNHNNNSVNIKIVKSSEKYYIQGVPGGKRQTALHGNNSIQFNSILYY